MAVAVACLQLLFPDQAYLFVDSSTVSHCSEWDRPKNCPLLLLMHHKGAEQLRDFVVTLEHCRQVFPQSHSYIDYRNMLIDITFGCLQESPTLLAFHVLSRVSHAHPGPTLLNRHDTFITGYLFIYLFVIRTLRYEYPLQTKHIMIQHFFNG
jgi:hypothetical protein